MKIINDNEIYKKEHEAICMNMFNSANVTIGDYCTSHKDKYKFLKRCQSVFFSACALIVLSPLMLIIALLVWLDDPTSKPIFSQYRVGKGGKLFRLYKFRTMYPNAEKSIINLLLKNEMNGPVFKMKNDPRITRIGKILRQTSLDELPQFWNVLKGEMALVGPRPALVPEVEQYDNYALQRLSVIPGLTCYWQIQPARNSILFEKWVELDLKYIKERSFLTDWKIVFQTVIAMIGKYGE